jgi:AraC-like DNA-binding protein
MIPAIAAMLAMHGIDARTLLREAGLPDEAMQGEIIAPLTRVQKFLDLAADAMRSPLFGIQLAERIPSGALGVIEFLMRSAPNVGRALELLHEFAPLLNPILDFRIETSGTQGRLHFAVPMQRDALGRHLNEYTFALVVRQFSIVLGERWPIEEVWFAHLRNDHRDEVAAWFGCPVTFGAIDCGVAVARASLDRAPSTSDPVLFEFLLGQARAQLANVGTRDMISQVVRVIETRLANGDVTAAAVAKAMATTVRSLQRHLADAGTSYREVLLHVRQRRRAELSRSGIPEPEIAKRLGFSDASTMRRSLDS